MKKVLLMGIAILLFSCSSDDSSDGNNLGSGTVLKTVKKYNNAGLLDLTTNYTYNSDGTISNSEIIDPTGFDSKTVDFNYDNSGELIGWVENKPYDDFFEYGFDEINELTYSEGQIVESCINKVYTQVGDFYDDQFDKVEVVYDGSNNPIEYTHYDYVPVFTGDESCTDVEYVSNSEFLEYDTIGNMIRYENNGGGFFGSYYYTYEYDTNNHPYSNSGNQTWRNMLGFSSVNNIAIGYEYDADTDALNATIIYAYEYNSSGYPTKLTKTYDTGGITQTTVFEYTYY